MFPENKHWILKNSEEESVDVEILELSMLDSEFYLDLTSFFIVEIYKSQSNKKRKFEIASVEAIKLRSIYIQTNIAQTLSHEALHNHLTCCMEIVHLGPSCDAASHKHEHSHI